MTTNMPTYTSGSAVQNALGVVRLDASGNVIGAANTTLTIAANTPYNAINFGSIEFQFSSGTVSVTRSLDSVNYVAWPVLNGSSTSPTLVASASTPGIYSVDGLAWLQFSAAVTIVGSN